MVELTFLDHTAGERIWMVTVADAGDAGVVITPGDAEHFRMAPHARAAESLDTDTAQH